MTATAYSPNSLYRSTKLHGVTPQKTTIFIVTISQNIKCHVL